MWQSKGVDEEPLEPAHLMETYREVLKYFNELSMNSRKAIETYPVPYPDIKSFALGFELINDRQLTALFMFIEVMNDGQDHSIDRCHNWRLN